MIFNIISNYQGVNFFLTHTVYAPDWWADAGCGPSISFFFFIVLTPGSLLPFSPLLTTRCGCEWGGVCGPVPPTPPPPSHFLFLSFLAYFFVFNYSPSPVLEQGTGWNVLPPWTPVARPLSTNETYHISAKGFFLRFWIFTITST